MCGRIVQKAGMPEYFSELAPRFRILSGYDGKPIGRYNVAPTTKVNILRVADDAVYVDPVKWGWAPFWAKGKRPDPINARVETVATGKFFKQLWPNGRVLVPSDGWFEWVKDEHDPKKKQPYFIRLKSQAPMFYGALAHVTPGLEQHDDDGFVIITAASDQGMVDIHDRRPLVLSPELATEWMDPSTDAIRAEEIAKECCRPVEDFEWFPVGKEVGNVRNQGAELIEPFARP
ncbi:SOS response-associated peptidase family protein [Pseudomonas viridiflava]|uniref:SOS response-associated peptidase family protein n=1 Tax=Pseudomonas viridiflava TaxID=33069 RepID=UPI000F029C06|nr:SOS response-associated peptidase family protein [Pseudomonas viridiflava]